MMTGAAGLEETVGLRLTAVTTKLYSIPSFPLFVGYLIFTSSARPIWKVAAPVDLKIPLILHNLSCGECVHVRCWSVRIDNNIVFAPCFRRKLERYPRLG